MPTDQKTLKELIARRHPFYVEMLPHWQFLQATYKGGRAWFKTNIHRYLKEGDGEFKDRLERAYRFNHTREIVNLVNKYVFKGDVHRNVADVSPELANFWENTTRQGVDVTEFMRQVDIATSTFGRIWVMVDSSASPASRTVKDQKKDGARVYAYIVEPMHVLDVGYDDDGNALWVLLYEEHRDAADPMKSSGSFVNRYRLWTRDAWMLIEATEDKRRPKIAIVDEGKNSLGVVPGFPVDCVGVSDNLYHSPALINDIAYLDRAVANYLSNLDAIIQDQTFSQLAMPAQGITPGDDAYQKLMEVGTKRIFLFDGQDGGKPFYLSPDPKQAELILAAIKSIIGEIYHSVGMAGERTKQDNAQGIDNSSGVAKAYDFERVNSLLVSKANALARAENKMAHLARMWLGEVKADDGVQKLVEYAKNFDVRGISDELDLASKLSLVGAPTLVLQEQMRLLVEKLFPRLSEDLKTQMAAAIKSWDPNQLATDLPEPGASARESQ